MFKSLFGSTTKKPTPSENIEAKLEEYNVKITHETLAFERKREQLRGFVAQGNDRVMQSPIAIRMVKQLKRQQDVILVYQTSIDALEATLTNLKLQKVTSETQSAIGHGSRATIDLDSADDTMAEMQEMAEQREMLASMMASNIGGNDDGMDDFILSLDLGTNSKSPSSSAPPVYATNIAAQIPSVPTTLPAPGAPPSNSPAAAEISVNTSVHATPNF